MSDEQIRRAVELCNASDARCSECPYYKRSASCLVELLRDVQELIRNQEREIMRLRQEREYMRLRKRLEGER